METPRVYAVIGGWDYEGQSFDSLRLFDCHSAAIAYEKHLKNEGFDYVLMEMRWIEMQPSLEEILATSR